MRNMIYAESGVVAAIGLAFALRLTSHLGLIETCLFHEPLRKLHSFLKKASCYQIQGGTPPL
jgi:hypothetical protein